MTNKKEMMTSTNTEEMMTSTNTKVTLKDNFLMIREILEKAERDDLVDFVDGRIAQIDKKASKSKSATVDLTELKTELKRVLADKEMTVSEMLKDEVLAELVDNSNQKLTARLRKLKDEGFVENLKVKKVSYYKLA